jgi:Cu2+-exporting ATPase
MLIEILLIGGSLIGIKNYRQQKKQKLSPKPAKSSSPSLYKKTTLQTIKETALIPFTGGKVRRQQLKEMANGKENQEQDAYKKINENFRFSIGLMGLSLFGAWWYPPLQLLSIAGVFYFFLPIFQNVFQDLKKKRITTNLLDSIIITGLIIMGHIFVATLFTLTALLTLKLRMQTENHSSQQLTNVFSQQPQSVWIRRDEAAYQVGYGIQVKLEETVVRVGSARFLQQEGISLPTEVESLQTQCETQGHSLVYVALNDQLGGVLELQPALRPEAKEVINYLKEKGISLYIISGDHEQPTRQLAGELGIEHYFAETLPEQKADLIAELRANGKFVCFVGDGINDAIALKQANVSISLRGASTAATDTAQIILMDGNLNKLKPLFEIAQAFESNMRTNYWLTIVPGVICLGGLFFLHISVVGGMATYYAGKVAGLGNTMLPLVKYAKNDEDQHSLNQQSLR